MKVHVMTGGTPLREFAQLAPTPDAQPVLYHAGGTYHRDSDTFARYSAFVTSLRSRSV